MANPDLNKNNPGLRQFYQSLTDVTGVFWEFHKTRLRIGDTVFTKNHIDGSWYDVGKDVILSNGTLLSASKPIDQFVLSAKTSMRDSWSDFLNSLGLGQQDPNHAYKVPEKCKPFIDPYVRDLAIKAENQGKNYSKLPFPEHYDLEEGVKLGINSGIGNTVQLSAIFGKDFDPFDAVKLSRITIESAGLAFGRIGRKTSIYPDPTYDLLDSKDHLNKDMLRSFGSGEARGCPVSLKISDETKRFLLEKCGTEVKRRMLEEFGQMVHAEFQAVRDWYESLHTELRQNVHSTERELLNGEVWQKVKERGIEGDSCPWSKERR